ncbi:TetR/AcrR family transcriptional regulator [Actinoplanes sp. TRM 88003]|uniref:TetR/AcrR family transcriptional regulator n=1 Tax=Paractinoplanes aksuensis TaxID=2939490 RepID=A0ABT1DKB9_9ACTN|nr:TetR family transcriptional regulator [Actinoplanes aksuensis]MCO8271293.1 TetR/AcrR family transcriptional regulator [Actinoplanes aksuensis]
MGRWEPNAQSRLRQAAMDLYAERGFDQTTVAEIAERAGLTERTFFRHFADKREVLFAGSERLQALLLKSVAESPLLSEAAAGPAALAAVAAAFEVAAADYFPPVEYSRQRQRVIDANPPLQEREVAKMDRISAALAGILRERGVGDLAAALAAEAGTGAFKVAFTRWVADPADGSLLGHVREAIAELRTLLPATA